MSEQLSPSPEPEKSKTDYAGLYKAAHPGAIEDPAKAEAMAHASKDDEEQIIEYRDTALTRMNQATELAADPEHADKVKIADRSGRSNVILAQYARREADENAEAAGEAYEQEKNR